MKFFEDLTVLVLEFLVAVIEFQFVHKENSVDEFDKILFDAFQAPSVELRF